MTYESCVEGGSAREAAEITKSGRKKSGKSAKKGGRRQRSNLMKGQDGKKGGLKQRSQLGQDAGRKKQEGPKIIDQSGEGGGEYGRNRRKKGWGFER